jgi:hypothetical protein
VLAVIVFHSIAGKWSPARLPAATASVETVSPPDLPFYHVARIYGRRATSTTHHELIRQTALQDRVGRAPREGSVRSHPPRDRRSRSRQLESSACQRQSRHRGPCPGRVSREQEKTLSDGVRKTVSDVHIAALFGNVIPDNVKVVDGLRGDPVSP